MQRVIVHAFVCGGFCILLLFVAVVIGVYRHEADRRPSDPYPVARAVFIAAEVILFCWPLVPLAYGIGAIAGAGVGAVRNGIDRRRARMSHQWSWMTDDD